jgi:hypothetical protein
VNSDENGERRIDRGNSFEDACVSCGRELEAAVLLRNCETKESDASELADHLLADDFVFVEFRRIDDPVSLHAIDLTDQTANNSRLCWIAFVQRCGVGKEQVVMNRTREHAAGE